MKSKAQRALAGIAAVVAAGYGTTTLWIVGHSAWSLVDSGSGSGGIGAVGSGLFEVLVPLASAGANRVLVRWARRAGGMALTLHRAHSTMLLVLGVLVVVLLAGLRAHLDVRLWIAIGLMAGFTLAAQSLLLAVMLAFFAKQEPVSAT